LKPPDTDTDGVTHGVTCTEAIDLDSTATKVVP